MMLKPTIASYSGSSYQAITAVLNERALEMVARVAEKPVAAIELNSALWRELAEIHILREEAGLVRLDTSVFLEQDIRKINEYVVGAGEELARLISEAVPEMREEPPEITNLVVGILGIGQTLGHTLRDSGMAVDWQHYGGRYPASKVDFDEVCDAHKVLGPDLQTKTVLRGMRYTAVFIGPGGPTYLLDASSMGATDAAKASYLHELNLFLTDALAMHLTNQLNHPALRVAAECVGLAPGGVLTGATMPRYTPVLDKVTRTTQDWCMGKLNAIVDLLRSTTGGRQGVPAANMVLNFWRYMRRAIARELYVRSLFTDAVPQRGVVTVFYENDIPVLRELLS